ncbi:hypothetical protein [Rufibacter psychrotolerans]|uniref:hypothetical protein n=1 Tax=Rufibacter psychrotolerans TaxID=2812556 RepID=UPI0019689625|nr:hypothetical protein [Rufibacter sp. SYSU D00308]
MNTKEYQKGCATLINTMTSHHLKKCLIDTNKRDNLPAESEEWEVAILQGEVVLCESKDLHVALVMSEEKYQRMVHNYSLSFAKPTSKPLNFHYFTKVEEAMDWLVNEPLAKE